MSHVSHSARNPHHHCRSTRLDRLLNSFLILLFSACTAPSPDPAPAPPAALPSPSSPPAPAAPVTISGPRFLRLSQPFFPVGNFLTSASPEGPRTHVYLSEVFTDADRRQMLEIAVAAGYNIFSVYTYNEHDYSREPISPFVGGGFGGALDETRLAVWRTRLEDIVAANLNPVIWLVPDDAPVIHAADDSTIAEYISAMVARFDDLPVLWILALEADEYWPDAKVNHLGEHLSSLTARPVGVHQLEGESHLMHSAWVDFAAYQYGFGKSWRRIFDDTKRLDAAFEKPFIGMEYDLKAGDVDDRLGLAAAFGGAAGVGNGAPPGLARFMEELAAAAPGGLTSSRSWSRATLRAPGVEAVAEMKTLAFRMQSSPGAARRGAPRRRRADRLLRPGSYLRIVTFALSWVRLPSRNRTK